MNHSIQWTFRCFDHTWSYFYMTETGNLSTWPRERFLSTSKLTQFADKVHCPVVAAEGRVQIDKEFGVEARYLPLQDVWDSLPIVFLVLPLPSRNDGPSAGRVRGVVKAVPDSSIIILTLKESDAFFFFLIFGTSKDDKGRRNVLWLIRQNLIIHTV